MAEYFSINGYWKDDESEFDGYIVKSTDDREEGDDDVFFYGLSETEIQEAIGNYDTCLEFIITSYEKVD